MKVQLSVNGLEYEASFSENEIENVIKPLIYKFQEIKKNKDKRVIIFLAAPPAVGKSTLALFIEKLSKSMENVLPIKHLSLDGFHHKNEYLNNNKINIFNEEVYLSEIKGMPETFNLEKFKKYLEKLKEKDIKWPIYDRQLHDVVEDQIEVKSGIVLIEGNWLLLDEKGWRNLVNKCDYSIFISAKEEQLKERLINRKIKGGAKPEDAIEFYEKSDKKNVKRVMENRINSDVVLRLKDSEEYEKIKGEF